MLQGFSYFDYLPKLLNSQNLLHFTRDICIFLSFLTTKRFPFNSTNFLFSILEFWLLTKSFILSSRIKPFKLNVIEIYFEFNNQMTKNWEKYIQMFLLKEFSEKLVSSLDEERRKNAHEWFLVKCPWCPRNVVHVSEER